MVVIVDEEDNNGKEAMIYAGAATALTGIGIYGYNACREDNTTAIVAQKESEPSLFCKATGYSIGLGGTFVLALALSYAALTARSDSKRRAMSQMDKDVQREFENLN